MILEIFKEINTYSVLMRIFKTKSGKKLKTKCDF